MAARFSRLIASLKSRPAGNGRGLALSSGWSWAAAAAVGGVLLLAGPMALAVDATPDRQMVHILNRLAFGPSAEAVRHARQLGVDRYIAEQLDPAAINESPELAERLGALNTLRMNPLELFVRYRPPEGAMKANMTPEQLNAHREETWIVYRQAAAARIWRALYSQRQLNEVMVDFWFNHFNVDGRKYLDRIWVGNYEEKAIRPYALGKFRDMLLATAHHPAMLFYLDNFQNSAPGTKLPNGKETGLNENYAREVMELHTLGVDGGYTQEDVVALARILTGWSFDRRGKTSRDESGFTFDKAHHDFGAKRFLGRNIAPSGEVEGIEALTILANSPATARHIAFKLAQYFVADQPPPALVDRLAARFQETDGDIRAVLQALFASGEFRGSIGSKYKTPYRYVLSATRVADVMVSNPQPLMSQMAQLGMRLYGCQTPDGYSDTADKWLSPDAGPMRVSFATALAAGNLPLHKQITYLGQTASHDTDKRKGAPVDAAAVQALIDPVLSDRTRSIVAGAPAGDRAALLLGSPDFMRR